MYNAIDVARYIIAYEYLQGRTVSNLRLQRLLYFVQAYCLASVGKPCFSTRMEAWDCGPVVPPVYREYRIFGAASIPAASSTSSIVAIEEADRPMLNEMLNRCASLSTTELMRRTHHQNPWKDAYHNPLSNEITPTAVEQYFSS